jgi:hypothetical protein
LSSVKQNFVKVLSERFQFWICVVLRPLRLLVFYDFLLVFTQRSAFTTIFGALLLLLLSFNVFTRLYGVLVYQRVLNVVGENTTVRLIWLLLVFFLISACCDATFINYLNTLGRFMFLDFLRYFFNFLVTLLYVVLLIFFVNGNVFTFQLITVEFMRFISIAVLRTVNYHWGSIL